eukprot:jgi/Tetstr1/465196/TSEL_009903.t1
MAIPLVAVMAVAACVVARRPLAKAAVDALLLLAGLLEGGAHLMARGWLACGGAPPTAAGCCRGAGRWSRRALPRPAGAYSPKDLLLLLLVAALLLGAALQGKRTLQRPTQAAGASALGSLEQAGTGGDDETDPDGAEEVDAVAEWQPREAEFNSEEEGAEEQDRRQVEEAAQVQALVEVEQLEGDEEGGVAVAADGNATAVESEAAFEQRVLLCTQPKDVARLAAAHFCSKGRPSMLRAMWTPAKPGYVPLKPPAHISADELSSLKDMMVFFPVNTIERAKQLTEKLAGAPTTSMQHSSRQTDIRTAQQPTQQPPLRTGQQRPTEARLSGAARLAGATCHPVDPEKEAQAKARQKMTDALLDAKSFLANRILHADEEGGDVDREVFIHQGNTEELRFSINATKEMRHWLPADDASAYEGHRYRTCAIVGNSGVARLTAYGADIDAHDAVFRMNQAPGSNGCQLYVGGRTTVRMVNARWLHKLAHGTMRHLPMEQNVTLLITRYDAKEVKRLLQQLEMTGRSDVKVRLMTQSLKARAQKLLQFYRYYLMTYKGFKDGPGESPSTGLLALTAAMQLCDQVTLYAFGLWGQHLRHAAERQSMYHYFHSLYGKKEVDAGSHSMDSERMLFQMMNEAGLVNMCSFKSHSQDVDGWESEGMRRQKEQQAADGRVLKPPHSGRGSRDAPPDVRGLLGVGLVKDANVPAVLAW